MKLLKQTALVAGILITGLVSAQSANMHNILKVGVNVGLPVPSENASFAAGVDVAYQNLITPGFGLGVATGYTHYFGKDNDGIKNNDFGVIPAAALVRIYPGQSGFYFGADLGYGFITGNGDVSENYVTDRPSGGLYIKPQLGYHNRDWNFGVHYQKVFTGDDGQIGDQKYNAGNIGVGVAYNIALGK